MNESIEKHRQEIIHAIKLNATSRANNGYRTYNWLRGYRHSPTEYTEAVKGVWAASLLMRHLNNRGCTWNYYVDRVCRLRLALSADEAEYKKLASEWWEFSRTSDHKVRREKHYNHMTEDSYFQLQRECVAQTCGEQMVTVFILSGDIDSVLQDPEKETAYNNLFATRKNELKWRWTGGETLTYEYWLSEHLIRIHSDQPNMSQWVAQAVPEHYYQPPVAVE